MAKLSGVNSSLSVTGSAWQGVRYGCTTRAGGVSGGPWATLNLGLHVGDDPAAVQENRRRLAQTLPGQPHWLEQVHGTHVVEIGGATPHAVPQADAAITVSPGEVLAIMTADCLPVVLADIDGRALGVAHAGWRGLADGILEATVHKLKTALPDSRGWRAWIGPAISQKNFEVGEEVRQIFVETDPAAERYFGHGQKPFKWQADLPGLARHRLVKSGVYAVEVCSLCTYECDKLFHSYRRSGVSGRMATLAWLEDGPDLP